MKKLQSERKRLFRSQLIEFKQALTLAEFLNKSLENLLEILSTRSSTINENLKGNLLKAPLTLASCLPVVMANKI